MLYLLSAQGQLWWSTHSGQSTLCVCVCSVKVLEDSKAVLIAANMQADDPFPMDDKIKEGQIMDHYTVTTLCSLLPLSHSMLI